MRNKWSWWVSNDPSLRLHPIRTRAEIQLLAPQSGTNIISITVLLANSRSEISIPSHNIGLCVWKHCLFQIMIWNRPRYESGWNSMRVGENGKWMKISAVLHVSMMLFVLQKHKGTCKLMLKHKKRTLSLILQNSIMEKDVYIWANLMGVDKQGRRQKD